MVSTIIRSTSVRAVQNPSRRPLPRECDRRPEFFDLPEVPQPSVETNPAQAEMALISFDEIDAEVAATQTFAKAARRAVNACKGCPFLQECRQDAEQRLRSGQRPQNEVVAGVAFDAEGLPDRRVHEKTTRRELDQFTLDEFLDIDAGHTDTATDWVPADLEPVSTVDDQLVRIALDENRTNTVVAQSYLDANPGESADGRIVLSYTDEWAVLTEGMRTGLTRHRIAQILGCTHQRSSEMAFLLGIPQEGKFEPSDWIRARRQIHETDVADARRRVRRRVAAQHFRDVKTIIRIDDERDMQRIAHRQHREIFRKQTPLFGRVRTLYADRHALAVRQSNMALRS